MKILCDIQSELYHEFYPIGNKLKMTFCTKCLYFNIFKVISTKSFFFSCIWYISLIKDINLFNLQETTSTQRSRAERKLRERTQ